MTCILLHYSTTTCQCPAMQRLLREGSREGCFVSPLANWWLVHREGVRQLGAHFAAVAKQAHIRTLLCQSGTLVAGRSRREREKKNASHIQTGPQQLFGIGMGGHAFASCPPCASFTPLALCLGTSVSPVAKHFRRDRRWSWKVGRSWLATTCLDYTYPHPPALADDSPRAVNFSHSLADIVDTSCTQAHTNANV